MKKILKENNINQKYSDERIKNITYDDFHILGFRHCSSETYHINLILCKFLSDFGRKLYNKYGVSIVSCTFNWDSGCYLVIGSRQETDEEEYQDGDCYEDIFTLEEYILKNIKPNGKVVYY